MNKKHSVFYKSKIFWRGKTQSQEKNLTSDKDLNFTETVVTSQMRILISNAQVYCQDVMRLYIN